MIIVDIVIINLINTNQKHSRQYVIATTVYSQEIYSSFYYKI